MIKSLRALALLILAGSFTLAGTSTADAATSQVINEASPYSDTGVIMHHCHRTKKGKWKIDGPASIAEPGQKKTLKIPYAMGKPNQGRVCIYIPAHSAAIVTDYFMFELHATKTIRNKSKKGKDKLVSMGNVAGDRLYTNILVGSD